MKLLFKKANEAGSDEYLALLEFRNTPVTGSSEFPAQLSMGRRLHSSFPMISSNPQSADENGKFVRNAIMIETFIAIKAKGFCEIQTWLNLEACHCDK